MPTPFSLQLTLLSGRYAVCRLEATAPLPDWATGSDFFTVSRTEDELSIVCPEHDVPSEVRAEMGWCAFKVQGPLDFGLTGVLASLTAPLARAGISVFAISTFDTDYLLVRAEHVDAAIAALEQAGFTLRR